MVRYANVAQLVERHPSKVNVAGSRPVIRSHLRSSMNAIPIPEYAVSCNTNRNPGITYGDARHVKSRISSTLRYYNEWSRISIYKRQGDKYVLFLNEEMINRFADQFGGDKDLIKEEVHHQINNA